MDADYYAILGVTHAATPDEIRAAYGELSEALRAYGAAGADAARLAQVEAAYRILGNGHKRVRYDLECMERELERSERVLQWNGLATVHADDPTSAMCFGQALAGRRGDLPVSRTYAGVRTVRGTDWKIAIEIGLEEAIRGGTITATYAIPGDGTAGTERNVQIRIPKLTRHGQELREAGQGASATEGGVPGDLYVEVRYRRHPLFQICGDDVWYHLPVAPWEAALGATLELPTMEVPFRVQVPAGTASGRTFRLPGGGLPKAGGGRGDLLACLRIVTPQSLTEAERQLYVWLSQVSTFDPRRGMQ